MVGVPGRSKACSTCRRRKKGCDFRRPSCTQCSKAGLQCAGYGERRVFVNSSQETWPKGSSYTAPSAPSASSELVRRRRSTSTISSRRSGSSTPVSEIVQPDTLTRTAYEARYLDLFWDVYFPRGGDSSRMAGSTSAIHRLYRDDDTLRLALLANSLAAIGMRDGVEWMVKESYRMYGQSLKELKRGLLSSSRAREDPMLAAVRWLSMFEIFFGSDHGNASVQSQNWERHKAGEMALLQARGPEAHSRGNAHDIFVDGRLHFYMISAKQRKKSFLAMPAWKTIPWRDTSKTDKDFLMDILLDIPDILDDFDTLRACNDPTQRAMLREALIEKCWIYDAEFQKWAVLTNTPIYTYGISGPQPTAKTVSPEDVSAAEIRALCWSGCLLLYSTLELISTPLERAHLPERADHTIYVRNIAQAMPILLDSSAGMLGRHVAAWPLAMALQFTVALEETPEPPSEVKMMLLRGMYCWDSNAIVTRDFILSMNAVSDRHPAWMTDMEGTVGIRARAQKWVGVS